MSTTRTRWSAKLVIRRALAHAARQRYIWHPTKANATTLTSRRAQVAYAERVLARHPAPPPLRERAYQEACKLIGVMEQGGNNRGAKVEAIIHANSGVTGEPWCGDFQAFAYSLAGSKAVTRSWASVRLLRGLAGVKPVAVPQRGDLVRFTFDHVGMFVRFVDATTIETIEGNTGASGAVSDSKTGGDGVYRKQRPTSLVRDYLRITR